jgi:hypothetical protein
MIMTAVDRRQELFENIARLRRAGSDVPGNRDIAAVRLALENELGETVSRRLAARILGVSHTALDRWINVGDLPVVYSRSGRFEVPLPALLELYEAIRAERADGHRNVLASTMTRRRDAARRLRVEEKVDSPDPHDRTRARNLAYHRAVANRLRKPMLDEARYALYRWREQGRIDPRYADRWEALLTRPIPEIRQALVESSQEADDLRQNSPLAGMLSEPERRRILAEVR